MSNKERLDILLVNRGLFESREKAKAAIMAGQIFMDTTRIDKAGTKVPVDANLTVKGNTLPYVSRGGLKLEKAIQIYPIDLTDAVMIDIGASTGGFTDCALQNGASKVFAIDVGYNQLAWKLRQDEHVINMESLKPVKKRSEREVLFESEQYMKRYFHVYYRLLMIANYIYTD